MRSVLRTRKIIQDIVGEQAFAIGCKRMFAARVQIPAVTLPERSYMRSSLADMADEIRDALSEAVVGAI
jgi:hypothetical protein